jgi:hypothetical protein
MHTTFVGALVIAAAACTFAPAVAETGMSGSHPIPARMDDGGHSHGHNGHHHHGHHRVRILLVPDGFFEPAPDPSAVPGYSEAPSLDATPQLPAPWPVELPPCRETSAGVEIVRGMGCTHEKR